MTYRCEFLTLSGSPTLTTVMLLFVYTDKTRGSY